MKTAVVDKGSLVFSGPAKMYESQKAVSVTIRGSTVIAGDVVVIRYEGPKGRPGIQEMLYNDHLPYIHGAR